MKQNLVVVLLVLLVSISYVFCQDDEDSLFSTGSGADSESSSDSALAEVADALGMSRRADSDDSTSSITSSIISSNGNNGNGLGSLGLAGSSLAGSSFGGSSSLGASPTSSSPLPRLGGNLLERFRNFNLLGRLRNFNDRARQFREGIQVNPDSLAYRTGRRISLTVQSLGQRAREWSEIYRQRQLASGASSSSDSANSI